MGNLERNEITGPPKVMWGKHDEIRELLGYAHWLKKEADDVYRIYFSK